jgi:hypothetical protein
LLYHHGYLERPRAQIDYYHQGGSRHIVYGLGNKGVAFLKEKGGSVFRLPPGEKNNSAGRIFLEHTLLVSEIMVAIELACRESGRVRLLSDEELQLLSNKRQLFRWKVNVNNSLKLSVIPDRVFGFEFKDTHGAATRAFFFLEADRGTMPVTRHSFSQTSFYRKMLAYEATWSQSIHRTRFGFNRFRVITITTSAARVKNLVTACSQLERGQGLFLFADRTILEKPGDMFTSIWQTGKAGEIGNLLD